MTKPKILHFLGNLLIFIAAVILVLTFTPVFEQEAKYQIKHTFNSPYKEKDLTPPNTDFAIVIPKIGAVAPVIANTDPLDPKKYMPVLYKGVAHAKGTAFPGEFGNTYIFAHSTDTFYNVGRYNAVFYLIGKLEKGDEIDIYYKGEKIVYEVVEKKVVGADAVKYLGKLGEWNTLTLQTCYPPGTTLKRLVVVANEKI
ncbi:MAG TPA: sortase [Patescibacteria group bacterium]|uniref:Sortase n=1 Tax=Candidatus Woesebacteria bacterium RBG_13_46_13 TaxID=1802479 RepID=A0A1F7X5J1_9BACT|nr:MAG: hypothetical protein A2Y68_02890 [Candidatus Woesebacteria bacterium RBG_13_46_13]HJX59054.1 sortase [Patescibacteria group bacterium]